MSEALMIQTLRSAMYDRLYGNFRAKLEIHPDSRRSLGKWGKEALGSGDTPSGEVFVYMGVEVKDNPDMPKGKLRVDREWTDADVDSWVLHRGDSGLLRWKLPPTDFDLPL